MTLAVAEKVDEPVWSVRYGKASDFKGGGRSSGGSIALAAARNLLRSQEVDADFTTKALAADSLEITEGSKDLKVMAKTVVEDIGVPNVVGLIEGSDPNLKDEVVAVGSHLDHMGTDGTTTWWGADDDGSGSTALIGVAKAFATNPVKPKRSVLFMAFCGEEMGLLGSSYYVQNPIIPLDKTVCLMQMDMVGRDSYGAQNGDPKRMDKVEENRDTMRLVGSKRISQELDDIIQDTNQHIGFKFKYDGEDVYTRSDHYNFARNGIPIAFQFCGFTPDYHQPTDTVDKINFEKLTNSAKLSYLTLMRVGNMEVRLKKNASK
jgi:Zn-dependent M28 family amino/carboxypeptidase